MKQTERVTLAEDELVTVFLGADQQVTAEFATHPRVHWIAAEAGNDAVDVMSKIPPKSRVMLLTEKIPPAIYSRITSQARGSGALYMHRNNPRAVRAALFSFFPKPKVGSSNGGGGGAHGKIKRFLEEHPPDLAKGSAEEARRLFGLAQQLGISTTFGSLSQAISLQKRRAGRGDIPASVRSEKDTILDTLAEAIGQCQTMVAALELMRDWITTTTKENAELKAAVENVRKLIGPASGQN
jgi:hypothetical protein